MVSVREILEGFFYFIFFVFGVKMIFQIHVIGLFFYQQEEVHTIPTRSSRTSLSRLQQQNLQRRSLLFQNMMDSGCARITCTDDENVTVRR